MLHTPEARLLRHIRASGSLGLRKPDPAGGPLAIIAPNPAPNPDDRSDTVLEFPDNRLLIDLCGELDRNIVQVLSLIHI